MTTKETEVRGLTGTVVRVWYKATEIATDVPTLIIVIDRIYVYDKRSVNTLHHEAASRNSMVFGARVIV